MGTVTSLLLATIAFVGTHMLLSHPLRAPIVGKLGEGGFQIVYSIIALFTFGWMVWAGIAMEPQGSHWIGPQWLWNWGAPALMLVSSVLLAGSFVGNPAFPDPNAGAAIVRPATGVFAVTRHPMNWAIMIWALTHIALSGTPLNLIVAGGIFTLTFFGSLAQDRKKQSLLGDAWRGWEERTSFIPFAAVFAGKIPVRALWPGWVALIGGVVIWIGASWLHAMPVGVWR